LHRETTLPRSPKAIAVTADLYAYFMHEDEPTGILNATALLSAAVEFTATESKAGAHK